MLTGGVLDRSDASNDADTSILVKFPRMSEGAMIASDGKIDLEALLTRQRVDFQNDRRSFMEEFLQKSEDQTNELIKSNIAESEKRIREDVTRQIEEVRKENAGQIAALKTSIASGSAVNTPVPIAGARHSPAPSVFSSVSRVGGAQSSTDRWEAKTVFIQGWITVFPPAPPEEEETETVKAAVDCILDQLPTSTKRLVDTEYTANVNTRAWCGRYMLKVTTGHSDCVKVAKEINAYLELTPVHIKGKPVRAVVDKRPDKKHLIARGARGMAILERMGISRERMRKPEWDPFKWHTKAVSDDPQHGRLAPRLLLSWSESTGYTLVREVALWLSPSFNFQSALDELNKDD